MAIIEESGSDGSSVKRLLIFGVVAFLVMMVYAGWTTLGPLLFQPAWKVEFKEAVATWSEDEAHSEAIMKATIERVGKDKKAAPAELMQLYRDYASCLWESQRFKEGDDQIEQGLHVCKTEPQPQSAEAMQTVQLHQDRGWSLYKRWVRDNSLPNGIQDEEAAADIVEKANGLESDEAMFKRSTLGLMYFDAGQKEKSKTIMDRCTATVEKKKSLTSGWYVYSMLAKIKALGHDYDGAMDAFVRARKAGGIDWRATQELTEGVSRSQSGSEVDRFTDVDGWLKSGSFVKIDSLCDKLIASKACSAKGRWDLQAVNSILQIDDADDETVIKQRLLDLQKWLKQYPQSHTARVALADCYTNYAWFARGSGYSNSVTKDGWKLFKERLAKAKALLDESPKLKQVDPMAYLSYSTIALGQKMDKSEYITMVNECHERWPTLVAIDSNTCWFLQERWYGEPHEWLEFATRRANEIGGVQGDKLYAQLMWSCTPYFDNIFEADKVNWQRVQSGFKQIFAEHPNDVNARLEFVKMASMAKADDETFKTAFRGFNGK